MRINTMMNDGRLGVVEAVAPLDKPMGAIPEGWQPAYRIPDPDPRRRGHGRFVPLTHDQQPPPSYGMWLIRPSRFLAVVPAIAATAR